MLCCIFSFQGSRYAMIFKEDEQFKDLLSLMEMLVNLLSKDFIDFAINGSGKCCFVSALL